MNQAEYDAMIQTVEKPQNEDAVYSACFPFYDGSSKFILPGQYVQQQRGNNLHLYSKVKLHVTLEQNQKISMIFRLGLEQQINMQNMC